MSKPFTLSEPYYDQDQFYGRLLHFYDLINPLRLFTTGKQIDEHRALLQRFKDGEFNAEKLKSDTALNTRLWTARSTLQAVQHPDTEERLNVCFMPCSFIPANFPICAGMLLAPQTQFNAAFWQWVNQSYNAGFNYINRPISAGVDDSDAFNSTMAAYLSATVVSCTVALGLNHWLKNAKLSPAMARNLQIAVPYTAVAGAGTFNVAAMRYKGLVDGIPFTHPESGEELGLSQNVAKTAITQCAISRVVLPAPILLIPPYVLPVAYRTFGGVAKSFLGKSAIELAVLTGALSIGLPFAIALFPQIGKYPVSSLEPEERKKCEALGLEYVRFNKGL